MDERVHVMTSYR